MCCSTHQSCCLLQHGETVPRVFQLLLRGNCLQKKKTEYDHFETTPKTSTTTKQIIFTSNTQHAQKLKSVEVLLFTSTKEELGSNF